MGSVSPADAAAAAVGYPLMHSHWDAAVDALDVAAVAPDHDDDDNDDDYVDDDGWVAWAALWVSAPFFRWSSAREW